MKRNSRIALLATALLFVSTALAEDAAQKTAVAANATTTLPAVTDKPQIAYVDGIDAEIALTYTYTYPATTAVETDPPLRDYVVPQVAYKIPLNSDAVLSYCWYPVGSFYVQLPRIIFYVTIIFAVLARSHIWLVAGALAASLTYSGTAAIHGSVDVWSKHSLGNMDLLPILGILIFSVAMFVPLLTWSKTIRNLGAEREEDAFGRTVIILWAFLISIGSISVIYALYWSPNSYRNGFPTASVAEWLRCMPESGVLDLAVGQNPSWNFLATTSEFIQANGCLDPCQQIETYTLTRSPDSQTSLTMKQFIIWVWTDSNDTTKRQQLGIDFFNKFAVIGSFATVWIIIQGFSAICFGRRNPHQARNFIYVRLALLLSRKDLETFRVEEHLLVHRLAKSIAYLYYAFTFFSSIISVLLAFSAIVSTEFISHEIAAGAEFYEVDSWSPWVSIALIIAVGFIARTQAFVEDVLARLLNRLTRLLNRCVHGRRADKSVRHPALYYEDYNRRINSSEGEPIINAMRNGFETAGQRLGHVRQWWKDLWRDNKAFWKDSWSLAKDDHAAFQPVRRLNVGHRVSGPYGGNDQGAAWERLDDPSDGPSRLQQPDEAWAGGHRYSRQAQESDGVQDRYRTRYDWDEFWSVFNGGGAKPAQPSPSMTELTSYDPHKNKQLPPRPDESD